MPHLTPMMTTLLFPCALCLDDDGASVNVFQWSYFKYRGCLATQKLLGPSFRGEWPSGLYSLRQMTGVKLGRVRSNSGWVTSEA